MHRVTIPRSGKHVSHAVNEKSSRNVHFENNKIIIYTLHDMSAF